MAEPSAKIARKYLVTGRVQGVGYRFFTEQAAAQLGICGYVKNLWDGTVEVYAIADAPTLQHFKYRLSEGPRSARVAAIEESEASVDKRYTRFVIEG
jgi:acylphosphatase